MRTKTLYTLHSLYFAEYFIHTLHQLCTWAAARLESVQCHVMAHNGETISGETGRQCGIMGGQELTLLFTLLLLHCGIHSALPNTWYKMFSDEQRNGLSLQHILDDLSMIIVIIIVTVIIVLLWQQRPRSDNCPALSCTATRPVDTSPLQCTVTLLWCCNALLHCNALWHRCDAPIHNTVCTSAVHAVTYFWRWCDARMLIYNVYCFVKILLVDTRPIIKSTQVLRSKYIS